jgi:hypothetical protein
MTFDPDPRSLGRAPVSRRGLLRTGGLGVSLAALVAACGSEESGEPGRVGIAPTPTPLPDAVVDDAVLLRTATSLEYSAIDVCEQMLEIGQLDGDAAAMVERLIEDHRRHADDMAALTTEAGGEPYECPNQWVAERVLTPLVARITGDEAAAIEPSDDPARDALAMVYAFESMLAATYQQMVVQLSSPALRQEAVTLGSEEARHAAAVAILRDGAPAAYVSPTLSGGTVDLTETDGVEPLFAVSARFGSLAPVEVTLGPPNDAGTRFRASLLTPAANTFVYADQACEA